MSASEHRSSGRARSERGVVAVVVTLSATVLLGAAALAVDLGRLAQRRHILQNAVDFGALAGAAHLPADDAAGAAAAADEARRYVAANAPGVDPSAIEVRFHCSAADTDEDGQPDPGQVPEVCGPASGTWTGWTGAAGRVHHACDPVAGDTCNAVDVAARDDGVSYTFAPVLGHERGSTGTVRAAACGSGCAGSAPALDVAVVFDRTGSMSDADMANAKRATLAMLETYEAGRHRVGLLTIPYPRAGDPCRSDAVFRYPWPGRSWTAVPLSDDYQDSAGGLNRTSRLVATVSCLERITWSGSGPNVGPNHTDIGDPIAEAQAMLERQGRPGVPDVIIVFTDGEANQPVGSDPCAYAVGAADAARRRGAEVFTIAYNVAAATCAQDRQGRFAGAPASSFLAALATDSTDDAPRGCAIGENSDGDHYFCEPGDTDLSRVFRRVADASARSSVLVDLS